MPFIPGETITTSTGMYSISKKPKMGYNAVVAGSLEYEVEIAVDENGITVSDIANRLNAGCNRVNVKHHVSVSNIGNFD